jgi:hypothetical protein
MDKKVLRIGLLGAGGTLKIESDFLSFQHPYGKTFRIPIADIETAAVDAKGLGKGILKIIGHGVELATVEMPVKWANDCQTWLLANKNSVY